MTRLRFFLEGIKNIKTTGTITRSSRFICKEMIKPVNFKEAMCIVELGAGDGVITRHILKEMRPDAKLISFEILPHLVEELREINDDRLIVADESAEEITKYLKQIGREQADYIISALPFVSLPEDLGERVMKECHKCLKEGGLYIQLHYSLIKKKVYKKVFGNVDVNFEPLNIPPAFVMVSIKEGTGPKQNGQSPKKKFRKKLINQ